MSKLCPKCSTYNTDESQFCCHCGASLSGDTTAVDLPSAQSEKQDDTITCPNCGSTNIHFVTIQSTQNFDTGDACCGYLLCGPLGLLCGVKKQTETRTVRKCMSCNFEF